MHEITHEALEVFDYLNPILRWIETMEDGRKQRTLNQNAALHLYCESLAKAFNDAGISRYEYMELLKSRGVELPWTKDSIKEQVWKVIQKALTGKESTTELNTVDPSEIYEVVNRFTAERFGVSVPFPSEENIE